jgi:NAD(P)-dependent dehydrogenase (short-subunit alcohol dehydrogenase family)
VDLQLTGKTAVVTGGSKGIGLAAVRLLIDEGMHVVSGSRTITAELKETGALAVTGDLSTPEGPKRLIDAAITQYGGIDVLVNNVGLGDPEDFVEGAVQNLIDLPDAEWERSFNLHFYSALWASRAALPSLIERNGVIVNVSSISARDPGSGPINYGVSKAALNSLTKVIAGQFGPQGVRAVTVSPGPVSTGVWTDAEGFLGQLAKRQGTTHAALVEQMTSTMNIPTQRVSTPEEVAKLIAFAASPNNITGTDYLIDGGIVRTA